MSASREDMIPPARPIIGEAEIEAAVRVLRSGRVVQGPEVRGVRGGVLRRWSAGGTASP